jgi:hypothetical protein
LVSEISISLQCDGFDLPKELCKFSNCHYIRSCGYLIKFTFLLPFFCSYNVMDLRLQRPIWSYKYWDVIKGHIWCLVHMLIHPHSHLFSFPKELLLHTQWCQQPWLLLENHEGTYVMTVGLGVTFHYNMRHTLCKALHLSLHTSQTIASTQIF